jgi:hypothetical protein
MRALLLQVFYSVRSERQLMEQMRYNLLFRWFVGLALDESTWDHSVFSKNRDRLLAHEVVEAFFAEVMALADKKGLLSKEHFSVDGTLIQAWASQKSFRPERRLERPDALGRRAQCPGRLERPAAQQRHPCEHDRSGCPPVPEEPQHGLDPVLPGACADGEPPRPGGRRGGHPCRRHRRTHGALAMLDTRAGQPRQDGGCGQGLRHGRLHRRLSQRKVTPHVARTTAGAAAAPSTAARRGMTATD